MAENNIPPYRYTATFANDIETKWQQHWEATKAFELPRFDDSSFDTSKPKFYCLDMFPYPSGAGLHVGHPEGYTATDIISRYKRMTGHNVLHPMGWDAFGLPAEQYAIATGVHPAETTRKAIDTFRRQLKRFGFSYDWSREFATINEDYYKWTQWIWLKAYNSWYDEAQGQARPIAELIQNLENGNIYVGPSGELVFPGTAGDTEALGGEPVGMRKWHELEQSERREVIDDQRLAYLGERVVNWCPKLGTVLANEEVIDGKSERGSFPVFRLPLKQWMFRITAYAERLLNDLEDLDWPSSTKTMQREWIGRSEGAEIRFEIARYPHAPRGEGAEDDSAHAERGGTGGSTFLEVFTTRPDTIFGATYMVIAPEHWLADEILESDITTPELIDYINTARNKSDVERQESKEKTGVFTGHHAINPATSQPIPIWIADYVLMGYGTGAIMAVPGHDERDFEFAKKFSLDIREVVSENETTSLRAASDAEGGITDDSTQHIDSPEPTRSVRVPFIGNGWNINSENDEISLNVLATEEAKDRIIHWLHRKGFGKARVNYKLRDWLFSRQRYWGEPFPIVFDEAGNHYPVDAANLPVTLPPMSDYEPIESDTPKPPLGKVTEWVHTTAGEAGVSPNMLNPDTKVTRETNTMPGWAGSCWYYLRYIDPKNNERFVSRDAEQYWAEGYHHAPRGEDAEGDSAHAERGGTRDALVDLYIGGAEHAVLHLLYARFWHKILFDLGEVSTKEPIQKLFHQGMIVSHAYQRDDKTLVPIDQVKVVGGSNENDPQFVEIATGKPVEQTIAKMSKSLKNVVNPDDVIADFGADTFRLYEMYMGPLEAMKPWNTNDIAGPFRFLQRVWRLVVDEETGETRYHNAPREGTARGTSTNPNIERQLHRTIAKVGDDIERLAFNTAIAAMIEFVNVATSEDTITADQLNRFTRILAPFAPHIAEEIWQQLGETAPLTHAPWPTYDPAMLIDDEVEMPVQIMGKVRSKIIIAADADNETIENAALNDETIQSQLEGKTVRKIIIVPGKIVNIVAN